MSEVDIMIFSEKLNLLRKTKGYTQEELAEKLCVSRQAIAKWESGQSYPDITNLIQISNLMNVTVDYLVRDQECSRNPVSANIGEIDKIIQFRLNANINTYAAFMNETNSSRYDSQRWHPERAILGGRKQDAFEADKRKKHRNCCSDAFFLTRGCCLFSVDDGFVDCVPASCIQTPVVRGVLVALNSHFSSLYFFVCINTHNTL